MTTDQLRELAEKRAEQNAIAKYKSKMGRASSRKNFQAGAYLFLEPLAVAMGALEKIKAAEIEYFREDGVMNGRPCNMREVSSDALAKIEAMLEGK